ncbi:MAG: Smr/MutS family protein [Nannocystaceae bacterium]
MSDVPPSPRRTLTEREVMEMLLRGDNVHELGDVDIVAPPTELPAASAPPSNAPPADPRDAPPATPPEPAEVAEAPNLPRVEEQLKRGARWAREPASPLEGIVSYAAMDPRPSETTEIFVIDLHGATRATLEPTLTEGIAAARRHGRRFVRVITGRGLHSADGYPVVRSAVELWLAQSVQAGVLAACAREDHIALFAPDYGSFMVRLPSQKAAADSKPSS